MSTDSDTTSGPNRVDTICPYCGVGCGLSVQNIGGGLLELEGREAYPVNQGKLCSKGRNLHQAAMQKGNRLLDPMVQDRESGARTAVSWDEALSKIARAFKHSQAEYGPDSVAFYVSGQCLTEEYYLANKIAKGFLGTNNIDTNSRLCMSSAVMGYKATLGDDLVPCSYEDLDQADCWLVAGANPSWCHPILWRRVEKRKEAHPNSKLIVIDPRVTETCAFADLHLQLKPGTDCILLNAIAAVLWDRGYWDEAFLEAHVTGWQELKAHLISKPLAERAIACGISPDDIVQAAEWIGRSERFMTMWTMGLNQSAFGTDKNIALIQLNLLTGQIGKPGAGPLSLTGQPNAMGGREVGGMATLLAAHLDPKSEADRNRVADHWGVPEISSIRGLTAMEQVEALESGKLKCVWIIATNPAVSLPDQDRFTKALKNADLVVVQDFSDQADSLPFADVILPAATWLEKEGCMTNSERRVSRVRKLLDPPGQARPDAEILIEFAHHMGWEDHFTYGSTSDVFDEYRDMTKGTFIDIGGISYDRIDQEGSIQWPCPNEGPGTTRLFEDGVFATPDGKARVHKVPDHLPLHPDKETYPLVLTTGRVRDQWHTRTRTARVQRLNLKDPAPYLEIHPEDAERIGAKDGWPVQVSSATGTAELPARISTDVRPGLVFAPMHWGRNPAGGRGLINRAVTGPLDPTSLQPDFKFTPVQVSVAEIPPQRVVVVGAGAGALEFISRYREHRPQDDLTVIGRELRGFYNRIQLPDYITGEMSWDDLITLPDAEAEEWGFRFRQGVAVTNVDRDTKVVTCDNGETFGYDKLVLSTGSRPFVPPGVPMENPGLFTLRTRGDADRAKDVLKPGTKVLVMGGGLLGIELAAALEASKVDCTVIEMAPRLMMRQLDDTASALLKQELEKRGIPVYTGDAVSEYATNDEGALTSVTTREGRSIDCEILFVAVGTRPNIEFLEGTGLDANRGIIVNDHLQTVDPDIYALGEIAEHRGMLYGITDGAQKQARIAAEHMAGNAWSSYDGSVLFNILKLHGSDLRSAGLNEIPEDAGEEDGWDDVVFKDLRRGIYQRCILQNNVLQGIQFVGDVDPWNRCKEWMDQGLELEDERDQLLRAPGGGEERPAVKGRLVCSCNQVGEGNLEDAIKDGILDLDTLCSTTKAGTGCGSCRPQVKSILDKSLATL